MPDAPNDRPSSNAEGAANLPRPFYASPWPRQKRAAAQALWHWHTALTHPQAPALDGEDLTAYFEAEQEKAAAAEPLKVVPEGVWQAAYAACDEHDLPPALLARQVGAARRLQRQEVRFATPRRLGAFVRRWALPHSLLLARLAGAGHSWQERPLFELARGFFLTGRLLSLPRDVREGRLFISEADLEQYGVAVQQLRAGPAGDAAPPEPVQRLFWKQAVRARDALTQGQQALAKELPRRYVGALRRHWLGALNVLDQLERRDYDVWNQAPLRLSWWRRAQIYLQAFLGRAGR